MIDFGQYHMCHYECVSVASPLHSWLSSIEILDPKNIKIFHLVPRVTITVCLSIGFSICSHMNAPSTIRIANTGDLCIILMLYILMSIMVIDKGHWKYYHRTSSAIKENEWLVNAVKLCVGGKKICSFIINRFAI